ncbi:LuxR C-terminal-related transcriptional regulator [Ramlibacter sp.]|uniref:LuxR C-terminal-related transcriptional regulator n=1 Tax=Ramlibacter sp. TaxID=1917967 RepID=UPI002D0369B9|nr:LuxR C-terminal-related transcriptional regulator [Ramlibacter sp.]HWI80384.1 LuxR C-terminal-related transcriptional regulator [Ramlibacter sp.]
MRRQIDVFVVAPPMLCWGFERMVDTAGAGIRVVGSAPHLGQAACDGQRVRADVVVLDFDEVLQPDVLRAANFNRPVLLLAPTREEHDIGHWTGAGVVAVLPKDGSPELLLRAIRSACDGARPAAGVSMIWIDGGAPAGATADGGDRSKLESLTARERQLLVAVVCNSTTPGKVLAEKLCISEHTLRNHLTSVYGKLGVQNRLSLHDFAQRHRLGEDPRFLQADGRRPGWRARSFNEAASMPPSSGAACSQTRPGQCAADMLNGFAAGPPAAP